MTSRDIDTRPLHQRIAADLRDEIMSGDLAAGTALPSTAKLTERFGASNATVQKALRILKDEGLVVGRAGASVRVREHRQRTMYPSEYMQPAEPGHPYRWIAHAAERGLTAGSRLLDVREEAPPADVANALGLAPGETAILRSQILTLDDEPAELVASYYPLDIAHGTPLAECVRIRGGTPTLLAEMGFAPRSAVDLVSARVPTQEQYEALRLPSDLPVLRVFRVVRTNDDRPIEVTVIAKAGHLYEQQYTVL
ncbi:GntR family transcriptional regulator [Actinomadura fibrosa]|uniref:GntR family transcriptional regulator n=1 Tax=Actinomadura fibrosa TaxID=111802 RepID=A0ABW2Y0X3_9ACTN|nr:GntR family transcriptional regulator [Actinomadura fibrosa]